VSDDNAITLPCGCTRGIVKRMAPALNPDGTAKIEGGAFVMEEVEEIQERFCDEHTLTMIRRQYDVQKALASGASSEEALALMAGASPFPLLGDGSDG